MTERSRTDTCAWRMLSLPMLAPGPITTCGCITTRSPMPPGGDDHEWADGHAAADTRIGGDDRRRVHAGGRPLVAAEQRQRIGKRPIGMRRSQHRARGRRRIVGQDDRARPGPLRGLRVLRVGEKRQVARAGLIERGDARDLDRAIALEAAAQAGGKVGKRHSRGLYHAPGMATRSKKRRRSVSSSRAAMASTRARRSSRSSSTRGRRSASASLGRVVHDHVIEPLPRAAHREVVPDQAEGEVVAQHVGTGHQDEQRRQQDQHAVDDEPAPMLLEVGLQRRPHDAHRGVAGQVVRMHQDGLVLAAQVPEQALFGDAFGHHPQRAALHPLEPPVLRLSSS